LQSVIRKSSTSKFRPRGAAASTEPLDIRSGFI
jgi:hypothetical protein